MAGVPLHYIDLRAFCYATEDDQRVERALRTLLPEEFPVERAESEGYHGDRILVFSARIENADDVRHVLSALAQLSDGEFRRLREETDQRVTEDCELYVYLDKQAAYQGTVRLGEGLTLRAKVEAYPAKKDSAVANVRDLLEEYAECRR